MRFSLTPLVCAFLIAGLAAPHAFGESPDARTQTLRPTNAGMEESEVQRGLKGALDVHAGGEQADAVGVAATMIRTLNLTGRRISLQTPDEVVVEGFLRRLDEDAGRRLPRRILRRLTASEPYLPGPFTRGELEGRAEEIEVLQGSLGDARRVLIHAGAQLGLSEEEALRKLRWETVERLGRALYDARGKDGTLLLKDVDSETLARWFYRDLPNRLVPHRWVANPDLDREALQRALANPFRLANEQGNRAAVEAMEGLLAEGRLGDEALTDIPERLQRTPALIIPWVRLLLAFNLIDYSQPAILAQIEKEEGKSEEEKLTRYVLGRAQTPFAWGDRNFDDLVRYVKQVIETSPPPGREHLLEVVLGDNNVQLAATLKLIEVKLSANPRLNVVLLLKGDNAVMNNASVADAEALLRAHPDFYRRLLQYQTEREGQRRRFWILPGPRSHGFPLDRVTRRIARLLQTADSIFVEGEANSWMVNQLRVPRYLAFRLKWPLGVRRVVGLQPEELEDHPPVFLSMGRTPYYDNVLSRRRGNRPLTIEEAWARPYAVIFRVRPGERVEGDLPTGEKVTFSVKRGRVVIPQPARYVTFRRRSLQPGAVWSYTLYKTIRGIFPRKRKGDEGYERRVDEGVYFFPLKTMEEFVEGGRLPPQALERLQQKGAISEQLKEAFLRGEIKVEELVNRANRPAEVVGELTQHRLPPRFLRVEAPYVFWELQRHFRWDGSLDYVTVEMRYREPPAPITGGSASGMEEVWQPRWNEWAPITGILREFRLMSSRLRLQRRINRLIQGLEGRDTAPALGPDLVQLYGIPMAIGAELERNPDQASATERLLELFGWANRLIQNPLFRVERSRGNRDEFLDLLLRYGARSALQASQDLEGLRRNLWTLSRLSQAFLPMGLDSISKMERALVYHHRFPPEFQPKEPREFAEQFGLLELAATPGIDWSATAPDEFAALAMGIGDFYRSERRFALLRREELLPATAGVPSFAGMEERRATEELLVGNVEMAVDDKRRITVPRQWRSYRTAAAVAGELVEENERRFIRLLLARTGESDSVPLDRQHRIRLPESWLSWVGVQAGGHVVLLGVKNHLELWIPAEWRQFRADGDAGYQQALEAALAKGSFRSSGMEEGIPEKQVLDNLRAIRQERTLINQQLDAEQHLRPEDLSEEMVLRYGMAVAEFNAVISNGPLAAEDLEREFLNFHQILGHGTIHQAGEYDEARIGEARALFQHLLSEQSRRERAEDPVAAAARLFVSLVNLQGFSDGNKRTASLLMNWVLLDADHTPFILTPENVVRYTQIVNPVREEKEDDQVRESEFRDFLEQEVRPRRLARGAGMEEEAVAILRSKSWPVRVEQLDAAFLQIRPLKPGQRSWHLGSGLSPLPVLEALMGLKVRAEDSNEGMKGVFDPALSSKGLDSLIAERGGEVVYLHSDVAWGPPPAEGSVDHIVAIDLFTGTKDWMDVEIQAVIRKIATAAAEKATILISGLGFVPTAADGAALLEQELQQRGVEFLKWDVGDLLPSDAADTKLWLFTLSPTLRDREPSIHFSPTSEQRGVVGFLLEEKGLAFGPLFALAATRGWQIPFAGIGTREQIEQLAGELPSVPAELLRARMVVSDGMSPEEARALAERLIQRQVPAKDFSALVVTPVREIWEDLLAQIEGYLRLVGLKLAGPEDRNRALEVLRAA